MSTYCSRDLESPSGAADGTTLRPANEEISKNEKGVGIQFLLLLLVRKSPTMVTIPSDIPPVAVGVLWRLWGYCDLVVKSRSQRGNHTFLHEIFVKSAIAREFGVERCQQMPALKLEA